MCRDDVQLQEGRSDVMHVGDDLDAVARIVQNVFARRAPTGTPKRARPLTSL